MNRIESTRRDFLKAVGMGLALAAVPARRPLLSSEVARPAGGNKPNFIIILTDDQGYSDLGCFGSETIATPYLDRMAAEGMKLTSFYSQTVCGPARCALMTGCYPKRVKSFDSNVIIPEWAVNGDEITLAEVFKPAGYVTGCVGKWDMSGRQVRQGMLPNDQGFDYFFGALGANGRGNIALWRNEDQVIRSDDMGALTELYTDEAIGFIQENRDKPFFLYLAHTMPHLKLGASEKFLGKSKAGLYGDVIEEIDWNVGRVLDAVRGLGLAGNTYVLFTSDNGPWLSKKELGGSAVPLRGGKGSSWEGGFRVPCIVWGPGRVPAGATSNELTATLDVLPTFAALAGAKVPTDRIIDGRDQSDLITGKSTESARDTFYYYVKGNLHAVRQGKWKLALPSRERHYGYAPDLKPVTTPELYDLESDVSEATDVSGRFPEVARSLLTLATRVRTDLGDLDYWGPKSRHTPEKAG